MSIAERLSFLGLDAETVAQLKTIRPEIENNIDKILDAFYRTLTSVPDLAAIFPDGDTGRAKAAQRRHWMDGVFAGNFDEGYMERCTRIGRAHERVGLEPRWYMAGYCQVLNQLVDLLAGKNRFAAKQAAALIKAVNKAVFLDMELAVSVYIETSQETARKIINDHADRFESDVKGMVDVVASAATELRAIAQAMAGVADHTAETSSTVAKNADITSANVQTVAAATAQLSAAVDEISRQTDAVRSVAAGAVDEAAAVRQGIDELSSAVHDIAEAARQVTDIAGRTRLLALNATIESARAGEQGRGFAVVAGEVKALADQAARVTDDIIARVNAVENATVAAAGKVGRVSEVIGRLHGVSTAIAAAVDQQGAATAEIARSVSLAAEGSRGITDHIGEVAGAASQTGTSAGHVLESSHQLSLNAEQLAHKVSLFLTDVRAA